MLFGRFFFENILLKCIKEPDSNVFSVELIDLIFLKEFICMKILEKSI
jgi:hypothetical protein